MNLHCTDLEKKWGQKGSTGQRFIFTEVTSYKIHILAPQNSQKLNSWPVYYSRLYGK